MTSSRPIDLTLDDTDVQSTAGCEDSIEATSEVQETGQNEENEESDEDNCSICLHRVEDRTVIPNCSHEFCFECLLVWIGRSRDCPCRLTSANVHPLRPVKTLSAVQPACWGIRDPQY